MKSIPSTMFWVQNATCSVSAKKLSTTRSSTRRPTSDRHVLLGDDLGRVEDVEREAVREVVVEQLEAELPLGEVARW